MLARVTSAAVLGIEAYLVEVEVDLAAGLPSFATVGLPHGAVKESRERVNAAIQNAGFTFPLARLTCNLAPADIPKAGSGFDLPIALGILAASEQLDVAPLQNWLVLGELGLDGEIRPVRGALSMARSNDPDSAGSQFFICVADSHFLDWQYTVFGEVESGLEVADKVVNSKRDGRDNPLERIEMTVTINE